jgi:hypothetical protein
MSASDGVPMPILPRPQRLSLHDAINYVAERCKCETEKAGKAVQAALTSEPLVRRAEIIGRIPRMAGVAVTLLAPRMVDVDPPARSRGGHGGLAFARPANGPLGPQCL